MQVRGVGIIKMASVIRVRILVLHISDMNGVYVPAIKSRMPV